MEQEIRLTSLLEVYGSSETGGVGWRDGGDKDFTLIGDIANREGALLRTDKVLDLQDRLEWTSERAFRVLGRKDNVVQVAGTNVNLNILRERILKETPAIDAALRLDKQQRLKAFIAVPKEVESAARDALTDLMSTLPAVERPSDIRFGDTLPRNAIGKLVDW